MDDVTTDKEENGTLLHKYNFDQNNQSLFNLLRSSAPKFVYKEDFLVIFPFKYLIRIELQLKLCVFSDRLNFYGV